VQEICQKTFWRNLPWWVAWARYDFTNQNAAGDFNRVGLAGIMKRFGYLHDRLFGFALMAYAVNRLVVLPHLAGFFHTHLHWAWAFLHSHFDDSLLMPAALPVVLWIQRITGLRKNDLPPTWPEMFSHLAIWSVMCKVVGPFYDHIGVADPWDVLFFTAGGFAACLWWNRPVEQFYSVAA
jgi:hypothetical protein